MALETGRLADAEPTLAAVHAARARLSGVVWRTPLLESRWLTERLGVPVHLKLECWQRTGSFKIRGAFNAVATLAATEHRPELVTASAGNHGQALALAARLRGLQATVFVPRSAPTAKTDRIREQGALLREVDGSYDDAAAAARAFASETGARFLHPFNDPAVVAGQGTVALELLEDLPELAQVVVPVGGGGLAAGVGIALREAASHDVGVVGVQSVETRAMHDAFAAGQVVPTPVTPTLCDGLAGETEEASYRRARRVTDRIHLVEEAYVAAGIRGLFQRHGVVAEGSGAVGVAAVLSGGIEPAGPTAVIISGGNIDMTVLARIFSSEA